MKIDALPNDTQQSLFKDERPDTEFLEKCHNNKKRTPSRVIYSSCEEKDDYDDVDMTETEGRSDGEEHYESPTKPRQVVIVPPSPRKVSPPKKSVSPKPRKSVSPKPKKSVSPQPKKSVSPQPRNSVSPPPKNTPAPKPKIKIYEPKPIQISRPNEDSDDIPMVDSKELQQVREHNLPTSNISSSFIQISRKKFSDQRADQKIEQQRVKIFE